jgi:hypothetical protein
MLTYSEMDEQKLKKLRTLDRAASMQRMKDVHAEVVDLYHQLILAKNQSAIVGKKSAANCCCIAE